LENYRLIKQVKKRVLLLVINNVTSRAK